jgi:serine/threonine protein kinase
VERSELVGGVIGDKYAIKGILGEGGMGVVYEAEHMAMGRIVAIKVLHPENAQKREAVSRLQHEAKVTGNLGHPNICEIYDMGRLEDGSPYVVMERLRGETLAQKIKQDGKVDPGPIVEIAMQVLSALGAAHASGIIHRDLKPENVFLAAKPGGLVVTKLLDFGISKAMLAAGDEDRLGLTQTGMVMGTPYYMAPEQARGDRALDSRVDIWAVGVMMYEAMTGRRPFLAKNYNALLVKILTVWHRSLAEVDPTIPPALALVVDKALSKMPEDRYRNAADMQEALKRFMPRKEVYPAAFGMQTVRPAEAPAAPSAAKAAPPTFGLPELDLHDETADGVPWTAVKQYVPTAQRNAVSAAIANQPSPQPPAAAPAPAPAPPPAAAMPAAPAPIPAPRPTPLMPAAPPGHGGAAYGGAAQGGAAPGAPPRAAMVPPAGAARYPQTPATSGPAASPPAVRPQPTSSAVPGALPAPPRAARRAPTGSSPAANPTRGFPHPSPSPAGGSPPSARSPAAAGAPAASPPRAALPPQVSPAPVAGHSSPQFAPRAGPAARVSQPGARVRPHIPPQPPPEHAAKPADVTEEPTIAEEPSESDDDDNETLVLVRDKLPLPKKQA